MGAGAFRAGSSRLSEGGRRAEELRPLVRCARAALAHLLELLLQRRQHVAAALADRAPLLLRQQRVAQRTRDHDRDGLILVEGVAELLLRVLWPPWIVPSALEKLSDGRLGADHEAVGQRGHGSKLGPTIRPALALREDFLGQEEQYGLQKSTRRTCDGQCCAACVA
jgi:hypothetical protein